MNFRPDSSCVRILSRLAQDGREGADAYPPPRGCEKAPEAGVHPECSNH
jgi:hypothetical protein